MDISSFVVRIIFLALPGLISSSFYRQLKGGRGKKDWEDVVEIVLFSVFSYGIYGAVVSLLRYAGLDLKPFTFFEAFYNDQLPLPWHEIAYAGAIAPLLAVLAAVNYHKSLLNRLGMKLGITERLGPEDIWTYFHWTYGANWVWVRDHSLNRTYYGWIVFYSDTGEERELTLRNVAIYDSESEHLYNLALLYLARDRNEITIEVPGELKDEARLDRANTKRGNLGPALQSAAGDRVRSRGEEGGSEPAADDNPATGDTPARE